MLDYDILDDLVYELAEAEYQALDLYSQLPDEYEV